MRSRSLTQGIGRPLHEAHGLLGYAIAEVTRFVHSASRACIARGYGRDYHGCVRP